MYPDWIISMFTGNTCPECKSIVTLDDIGAIGVGRPDQHLAHLREPMAMIIATCPHCDQLLHFSMLCSTELLLDAAKELARLIETAPAGDAPLFGPGSVQARASTPTGGDVAPKHVRPSIRGGQADGPLTDAEVKSLLARLRRASFRAGSKNFRGLPALDQDHDGSAQGDGGSNE